MDRPRSSTSTVAVAVSVVAVVVAAGLLVTVVRLATRSEVELDLGAQDFRVGPARRLAPEVGRDGPLLFQALTGNRDLYVQHLGGDPSTGWLAFDARAPGAPRECLLRWDPEARRFVDRCTGRSFPADGAGLPSYPTTVDREGRVVVDLDAGPARR